MDSRQLAEMIAAIRAEGRNIHSLLVARHGHLVLEAYFDPFYAEAPHRLYSCTKSVTSSIVGIAIGKGLLQGVDQPVYELFPEVALDDPRKQEITVEHLLSMSSGLEWPEGEIEYRSPNNPYSATSYLEHSAQYVFDQPLIEQPGTLFNYNSGGSHLLSMMVSRAAGMSTLEFARRELFAPLGISVAEWDKTEDGMNSGGTGLRLLPRDMAKFGQLYLQGGRWDGQPVIPEAWVIASSQPNISFQDGIEYGYQWWIPQGKGFLAQGWGQQDIWVLPEQDMVVVVTAGLRNDTWLPYAQYLDTYILPAIKSSEALPPDPEAETLLAAELQAAQHPAPQPVQPLPPLAEQLVGKTYLVTDASITMGLQSITIKGFTPDEMQIEMGVGNEDMLLSAGLDGVFRRSPTETSEVALKGTWEDEQTLALTWQDVTSAEGASMRLTYQGEELLVQVDLFVEGIGETSHGSLLR